MNGQQIYGMTAFNIQRHCDGEAVTKKNPYNSDTLRTARTATTKT